MLIPRFEYRTARAVDEAIGLFAEVPGARYLAGGTDLLPQMRMGSKKPPRVIDVKRITGLEAIAARPDGTVSIGAGATLSAIAEHAAVRERYPLLRDCALAVGAYPLRNRATLAGNLCNASPAADTAVALLALDASVVAAGPKGKRTLPLSTFFLAPGRTALAEGELVTEILLPPASAGLRGSYLRLSRRKGMDLATVGVLVGRSQDGASWRVALAAVAPTPLRVVEAEQLLAGEGPRAAEQAAGLARDLCKPITDLRGTAEYRRDMVGVLAARGLAALAEEAAR